MSNRGPSIVLGGVQWGPDRYPALWVWEPYGEKRGGSYGEYHSFPLHRLTAFAHGIVDHPRFESFDVVAVEEDEQGELVAWNDPDTREVHHVDEDKQNGRPENLEAHPPQDHGRITRESQLAADGGQP